jgi:predicted enzyme related to lactoylglutathione lyase
MIRKLGTVMVAVSDLPRSIEFYRDVLGLDVEQHSDTWAQADAGGTSIGMHVSENVNADQSIVLIFDVDDVDGTLDAVRQRGLEPAGEPDDQPYGRIATVTDPDGYTVQILQPAH